MSNQRLVVRNGAPPCRASITVEGDGKPIVAGFLWSAGGGAGLPNVSVRWDGLTTDLDVEAKVVNSDETGVKRARVRCPGLARKTVVTDLDTGKDVPIVAVTVECGDAGFVCWLWRWLPGMGG